MPKLQDHFESLGALPHTEQIQAIADVTPGLKAVKIPECEYWVEHPNYEGRAKLTDLARHFMIAGETCRDGGVPLDVRLLHQSMHDPLFLIYRALHEFRLKGFEDGTIVEPEPDLDNPCGICSGNPASMMISGMYDTQAFYFPAKEYKALWGDAPGHGWIGINKYICASKEQIEEALARKQVDLEGSGAEERAEPTDEAASGSFWGWVWSIWK